MNLRKITLKHMGWCPGVESAARFIPERDAPNKTVIALAVSFASIIIVGLFAAQNLLTRPASGPLEIKIDGVTYADEEFDEDFDYPGLRGSYIDFTILPNASEFSASGKSETQIYDFEELEEAWLLLEELDTPSVVVGFARWLSNRTFNEAYQEFYGRDPMEIEDLSSTPEVSLTLGSRMTQRCRFEVNRYPSSTGGVDIYVNGTDGICIFKRGDRDRKAHCSLASVHQAQRHAAIPRALLQIPLPLKITRTHQTWDAHRIDNTTYCTLHVQTCSRESNGGLV